MDREGIVGIGTDDSFFAPGWLKVNQRVYGATGRTVEKYNVVDMSLEAGGECPVQDGFGCTYGVALDLLAQDSVQVRQ